MGWRAIVICLALCPLIGACEDSQEAKLSRVKDVVCACKTASCAEAAMKDVPQQDLPSNTRTQKVARDMLDCLAKLYDAERPAPAE